ncbi:BRO1-like domain-containing protein [Ochromonadaceae sp. CCMP2298]|nr:BRO1-like domain-containing protein [Ochromonadaceae sp. CCMP2298]|mmetsp:Transcript_21503/g.47829  ORF Transcript_21503/g.47829 Transcript_21503/m.47829 type:complete len:484 (+) Transcript_21503:105-1556(+)|eukprot:CAMPEP_0173237686 /NCGR_PEP_ID=MMETSP1142-20121109/12199_1 /TAXON_ID=483371 /ORGANISM="non described non described, Strain CCMP2298" /LENGTH=483 /DNA_ID=CAMNT_0014168425 /DNA_START=99 /DNA_END=1550 /DNA_ORIENTATION=-
MASASDVAKLNGYRSGCVRMFVFALPTCRPFDLGVCYASSTGTEDSAAFVQALGKSRMEVSILLNNMSSLEDKLASLNTYLVHALRLHELYTRSPESVKVDRDPEYIWRGCMTLPTEQILRTNDVLYEVMMLLHTKALVLHNLAKSLVDTDPLAFVADAGKHLLEASSIMTYLGDNISSDKWKRSFSRRLPNPRELNEHICYALAATFKAHAQALSFAKTLSASAPDSIKARLCVGVSSTCAAAMQSLSQAEGGLPASSALTTHLHCTRQLYLAMAHYHQAQAYLEKKEVGNSIAYCRTARSHLAEQAKAVKIAWTAVGLPKTASRELGPMLVYLGEVIAVTDKAANQDNNFVYFQVTPGPTETPPLPLEASVMNPPRYAEPPQAQDLQLVYVPKKSVMSQFSSVFSWGSSAKKEPEDKADGAPAPAAESAPAPAPAPDAPMSADEAYARQLQLQFDAQAQAPPSAPPAPPTPPGPPQYNSLV